MILFDEIRTGIPGNPASRHKKWEVPFVDSARQAEGLAE